MSRLPTVGGDSGSWGTVLNDFLSVGHNSDGTLKDVVRGATLIVSASDSSALAKSQSDHQCDGTADQVEIQAAIDALPAVGGKIILAEGTFNLSSPIILTNLNNISIEGCGESTKIKVVSGSGHMLRCTPANPDWSSNINIKNLYLDCNDLGSYCIIFNRVTDFKLSNIYARYATQHNISLYDCTNGQVHNVIAEYSGDDNIAFGGTAAFINLNNIIVRYSRGTASGASSGLEIDDVTSGGFHNISNVIAHDNYGSGIEVHMHNGCGGPTNINYTNICSYHNKRGIYIGSAETEDTYTSIIRHISIQNVQLYDNTETGLYIQDADGVVVTGGIIEENDTYGIYITDKSYRIKISDCHVRNNASTSAGNGICVEGTTVKDIQIINCHVEGTLRTNGPGLYINTGVEAFVQNCTFYNNAQRSIWSRAANAKIIGCRIYSNVNNVYITGANTLIANCQIYNTAANKAGITLGADNCTIVNCEIFDNQGTKTQDYAIENSSAKYAYILGNNLHDNRVSTFYPAFPSEMWHIKGNMGLSPTQERELIYVKNTSGGNLVAGNVVVLKAVATGNEITTSVTEGDPKVLGMLVENINNNAYGYVLVSGKTALLMANGVVDIAIGDLLGTYTSAGIAMKASAGDMVFAVALEAYTADDSSGIIDALLISPRKI